MKTLGPCRVAASRMALGSQNVIRKLPRLSDRFRFAFTLDGPIATKEQEDR